MKNTSRKWTSNDTVAICVTTVFGLILFLIDHRHPWAIVIATVAIFLLLIFPIIYFVHSAGWRTVVFISTFLFIGVFAWGIWPPKAKPEVTLTTTPPPPGPKSEPPKTTATSENTTRQNPKRAAVGRKKKIPTAATTAPNPLPPAQAQTTLPSQQVGVGIVNNAPNNGTQVVQDNRQYGVSPPPPDLDFHQSQIDPWPEPPLGTGPMARREKDMEMLVGPNAGRYRPGVSVVVTLKGPFEYPLFWIRCSAPCSVNDASSNANSENRTAYPSSSDPTIARVQFIAPTKLPVGTKIFLDIRSVDKTKITVLAVGGGEPPD